MSHFGITILASIGRESILLRRQPQLLAQRLRRATCEGRAGNPSHPSARVGNPAGGERARPCGPLPERVVPARAGVIKGPGQSDGVSVLA